MDIKLFTEFLFFVLKIIHQKTWLLWKTHFPLMVQSKLFPFNTTVKPGHPSTSIQREPPLSVQILVLPIAFTLNWTFFQQAPCKRVQRARNRVPFFKKPVFSGQENDRCRVAKGKFYPGAFLTNNKYWTNNRVSKPDYLSHASLIDRFWLEVYLGFHGNN